MSFVLFASCALAREERIPNSTSPDKHFYVAVEEVDGQIYYRVKERCTDRNRIAFSSEYRPAPGELANWSYQQALAAEIHWRTDSRCVALDEANHNYMGTVRVACLTKQGFRRIPLNATSLMRSTKDQWDRGRLFFGSWGTRHTVSVYLRGKIDIDPNSPEYRRCEDCSYTFTIDLIHCGRITSRKLGAPLE